MSYLTLDYYVKYIITKVNQYWKTRDKNRKELIYYRFQT